MIHVIQSSFYRHVSSELLGFFVAKLFGSDSHPWAYEVIVRSSSQQEQSSDAGKVKMHQLRIWCTSQSCIQQKVWLNQTWTCLPQTTCWDGEYSTVLCSHMHCFSTMCFHTSCSSGYVNFLPAGLRFTLPDCFGSCTSTNSSLDLISVITGALSRISQAFPMTLICSEVHTISHP